MVLTSGREKQRVELDGSRVKEGVQELLEDALAQLAAHHLQANTLVKPSTIAITVTVTPDEDRRVFSFQVNSKVTPAPKKGFVDKAIFGRDEDDVIVVKPLQMELGKF